MESLGWRCSRGSLCLFVVVVFLQDLCLQPFARLFLGGGPTCTSAFWYRHSQRPSSGHRQQMGLREGSMEVNNLHQVFQHRQTLPQNFLYFHLFHKDTKFVNWQYRDRRVVSIWEAIEAKESEAFSWFYFIIMLILAHSMKAIWWLFRNHLRFWMTQISTKKDAAFFLFFFCQRVDP